MTVAFAIEPRTRTVATPTGAELYVVERGDPEAPTVVLVHGFPDTHGCWDELAERLAARFHVVAYDVRGAGRSSAPPGPQAYALPALAGDLGAVIAAVSPDRPVHLVGHDWGSFQCWEAIVTDGIADRIASFTGIAAPRLDRTPEWIRRRLRRPGPRALRELAGQARRSWYIGAFQVPGLPDRLLGPGMARTWPALLRRLERVAPRPGHPADSLARDAVRGLALYRTNLGPRSRFPRRGPAAVPVQLIVPTRDRYISAALFAEAGEWADAVWRREIRTGHWAQRTHPDAVARYVGELVDHVESGETTPALARARVAADPRPLAGRLAVVTGAGSGIGRATALALAAQGAEVVAADIDGAAAAETAGAGPGAGPDSAETAAAAGGAGSIHAIVVDVADAAAMERFAADVVREHGVPDIVVNNAGIGIGGPFLDTTPADWERILGVNLWGVVHGARLFARMMVDAGVAGQIVNVASAAAYTPSRALSAYATTKAGVLMLSECLRAELAGHGIGVTAICPGIVNTNIVRSGHLVGVTPEEEAARQRRAARAYARRGYGPEGVAAAIVRAVRRDPAVVPVTPEAHVTRALSRVAPASLRALARLDPG